MAFSGSSFNDLRRPPQERLRERQAERLRRLQVDDELELCRLLDWEVGGLCTFKDAFDIDWSATVHVQVIGTIRNQRALFRSNWDANIVPNPYLIAAAMICPRPA